MSDLRLEIIHKFYRNFSQTCCIRELHNSAATRLFCYASKGNSSRHRVKTYDYSSLELEELLIALRFYESQSRVKEYQFVQAFISLLLQLLHPEIDRLDRMVYRKWKDQIENLEKELRILLVILGDTSLLLCDDKHEELQKLLAEFEAVANEAGSLVCSLVSPSASSYVKLEEEFDVVLNRIDILKTSIIRFLNLLPSISTSSAYITPKASVVDSVLIVDSLIHDLRDLMNREDDSIADVKDQVKTLHQVLTFLKSSIKHIGSPRPSEIGEIKDPLMRIGDIAHQAEYLIVSFLVGDAPPWYLITRLTDINDKIDRIATELTGITKKYSSGGLNVAKHFSLQRSLQAKENTEASEVTVGLEEEAIHILDKLVGGTERLQVISIFGMPGLGKTTLAKKLYNHPSVNYWFDKLSWCVVSQTYLRRSLLTNILIRIESEFEKDKILKMEEESLVEHIYKSLKGRRYLIVMDDIWTLNVWDDLRRCFPDDRNGSRILFTNRNKDVAPPNSIIYAQPSLSNDQCWELLKKKAFHDQPCPPELQEIGKKIAANCCRLPLAVVVIAGILSSMDKEKSTWEEVEGNLASYIFDDGDNSSVMRILELSYKDLPDHLKPCFLYFGAFEEDEEIPARKLMRLWIAEGFIRKEAGKSAENVAEEYLMELIDKSLVMVAKRRLDGGVKACVIHDLLRDLCFKICEDENFLRFEKSDIDFMSRQYETSPSGSLDSATWSYCQHIRSFHGSWLTSRLCVRDMRLLRVLDSEYRFKQLIGIEDLVNLRYLVITDDLVASIGRLVNLEYLRVVSKSTYGRVVYLPPEIMKFRKLRYIHVLSGAAKYHKDCISSSQPNNLEYLSGLTIGERKDENMLKCSPRLRKLKCYWRYSSSVNFDLRFLTQLESLNAGFWGLGSVKKISFPSSIKKLTLSGSRLTWEEMMSIIVRLERLEILKLEYVVASGAERWDTREIEFEKLRFLQLRGTNLTQWSLESSKHFPKLQRLVLSNCYNLREIPSEIGEIAALEMIEIQGECTKTLVESAQKIKQEQWDMGNEELRVIISSTYTRDVTAPNKANGVLQKLFTSCC